MIIDSSEALKKKTKNSALGNVSFLGQGCNEVVRELNLSASGSVKTAEDTQ